MRNSLTIDPFTWWQHKPDNQCHLQKWLHPKRAFALSGVQGSNSAPVCVAGRMQPLLPAPCDVGAQMRQPVHHALHAGLVARDHLRRRVPQGINMRHKQAVAVHAAAQQWWENILKL